MGGFGAATGKLSAGFGGSGRAMVGSLAGDGTLDEDDDSGAEVDDRSTALFARSLLSSNLNVGGGILGMTEASPGFA